MQYLSSLPDDKPGKILSFTRGRGNKLTGTFDQEAWLRGPGSAVLEREGSKALSFANVALPRILV